MKVRIVLLAVLILVATAAWLQMPRVVFAAHSTEELTEGFESGKLVTSPLSWTTGGDAFWFADIILNPRTKTHPHKGLYAAKAGYIIGDQHTWLETYIDVKDAGKITFYYQITTTSSNDFFRFLVDDKEVGRWRGKTGWKQVSFDIKRGEHTFRWEFVMGKPLSCREGSAWIDDISFPAGAVGLAWMKDQYAKVEKVEGEVEVKRPGDKDWVRAEVNMDLSPGTEVSTSIESSVKLQWLFPDGKSTNIVVKVGELTIMKVNDIYKKRDKINAKIDVKIGSIEFNIGKKEKYRSNLKVSTHSSVAGVTGTIFSVSNSKDNVATITVIEGEVLVQSNFSDQKVELIGPVFYPVQLGCGGHSLPARRVTVNAEGRISEPDLIVLEPGNFWFPIPEKCFYPEFKPWHNITENLFDKLVEYDSNYWLCRIRGELAYDYWDESDDETEVTFYLRDDVQFHDGTYFDAEAVAFNFRNDINLFAGHRRESPIKSGLIQGIEVLDDFTIKFYLDPDQMDPWQLLGYLASPWGAIVSPEAWRSYGGDLGSGPFRVVEEDLWLDKRVVLEPFVDYWKGTPFPSLKRVVFVTRSHGFERCHMLTTGAAQVMAENDPQIYEELILSSGVEFIVCGIPTDFRVMSIELEAAGLYCPPVGPLYFEKVSDLEELTVVLPFF